MPTVQIPQRTFALSLVSKNSDGTITFKNETQYHMNFKKVTDTTNSWGTAVPPGSTVTIGPYGTTYYGKIAYTDNKAPFIFFINPTPVQSDIYIYI